MLLMQGNIATEDIIHGFEEMGISTRVDLNRVIDIAKLFEQRFPKHSDSFILKAGKCSDLHIAPKEQEKIGG